MSIKFLNTSHEKNFIVYQESAGGDGPYFDSALYLLAFLDKNLDRYIDDGILFEEILIAAEKWSTGERALVNLAATLFNGGTYQCEVDRTFNELDNEHFLVALNALVMRYKPNSRG